MMRCLSVVILVLFLSCSSENTPSGFVEADKMRFIMWDMARADEMISNRKTHDSSVNVKQASFELYEQVFAVHKISREQFYKSLRYYEERPQLLRVLMDSVRSLSERKPANQLKSVKLQ